MKTTDRMTVNVHDINEFHGEAMPNSEHKLFYAERLRDYNPDNLPAHMIIHDNGKFRLFEQDGEEDMYFAVDQRTDAGDVFQLIPKYYHGNTAVTNVNGEKRLVTFPEGTEHARAIAIRDAITRETELIVANISQRYAEWLLLEHLNWGVEVPMWPGIARQHQYMTGQFQVFSYNKRVE